MKHSDTLIFNYEMEKQYFLDDLASFKENNNAWKMQVTPFRRLNLHSLLAARMKTKRTYFNTLWRGLMSTDLISKSWILCCWSSSSTHCRKAAGSGSCSYWGWQEEIWEGGLLKAIFGNFQPLLLNSNMFVDDSKAKKQIWVTACCTELQNNLYTLEVYGEPKIKSVV